MSSPRVKIGDTIEFAAITDETVASTTLGRVVDVKPSEPELCTVQLSPFESLRTIDLQRHRCKIVYAVGDIVQITPRMIGWQIEIASETQQIEPAVVKRVDSDINCALVAFESGKKEWLDLTLSAFKVRVRQATVATDRDTNADNDDRPKDHISHLITHPDHESEGQKSVDEGSANQADHSSSQLRPAIPPINVPSRGAIDSLSDSTVADTTSAMQFARKAPPESDATSFDWYSEGGHVEICDARGGFLEGAILCSKSDTHIQLYNEARQFFEVSIATQSFKVVVHGLLSLKWMPMGQAIEVYSAMTGGFHQGIAIKAAEVGKLTPVRFLSGAVEWLDLSMQTFKLVFIVDHEAEVIDDEEDFQSPDSPLKATLSPIHKTHHQHQHRHHHQHRDVPVRTALQLPALSVGQRIEIFDGASKQYAKCKVATAAESIAHEYEFEPQSSSTESMIAAKLANMRCRIPLLPHMWDEYRTILPGHRVDIYDKAEKTVVNAKILEVGVGGSLEPHQHSILVRYKNGRKSWVHSQNVKVKLRLHGEPLGVQTAQTNGTSHFRSVEEAESLGPSGREPAEMWERPLRPGSPLEGELRHQREHQISVSKPHIVRHLSDLAALPSAAPSYDISAQSQLAHAASTSDLLNQRFIEIDSMAMTQKIPSIVLPLDFSTLRKLQSATAASDSDAPAYSATPEFRADVNGTSQSSRSSARSRRSDSLAPTSARLPFSLAEVWREELDPGGLSQIAYVHRVSGARQSHVPEWLERSDAASGKLFVVHTPSNTLYSVPAVASSTAASAAVEAKRLSSRRANSSAPGTAQSLSPGDSGGRAVVPIGAIEAVRVYNMLDK